MLPGKVAEGIILKHASFQSVPEDLKAGFTRYGGGRIPTSHLPKKIDIDVPGGEMPWELSEDVCRVRSLISFQCLIVSQSTDTPNPSEPDLDLEIMVPLVYPMTVYDFQDTDRYNN
ncbi:hypothetical protein QFC21_001904 [Naganishia friedmannii]|uniref:Uncharacterized protein n=1 Tax=Naganishia friedmannii TaxID=89922 RepID=A0ACC2W1H3_9TREE|nr:hypothetical protein QFC21_001904 [Naganishia friedmannii]